MTVNVVQSLRRSLRRRILARIRRQVLDPLGERGNRSPSLILHCCHHKTGTVWFLSVLRAVAVHFGLRFHNLRRGPLPERVDLALSSNSQVDLGSLAPVVGSHMIRDPRDVVVSGYHYHLWTEEAWAREPSARWGGKSYQEHLRSLDLEEGLAVEIERTLPVFEQMRRWDYDDPRFLELRYEDAMADPTAAYRAVFRHYGFRPEVLETAVAIADRFSFRNRTGRSVGETREGQHLRSGAAGQWRESFSPDHRALFKQMTGDLLVVLGYEADDTW